MNSSGKEGELITSMYFKYSTYKIILKSVNMFQKMNQTKPRPKWKDEPSAQDRKEGWEKLQKLKDRHRFLRNPRFLPPNAQQGGTSLIQPRTKVGKMENVRKGVEEQRYQESIEKRALFIMSQ